MRLLELTLQGSVPVIRPGCCPDDAWARSLVAMCTRWDPSSRPTFDELAAMVVVDGESGSGDEGSGTVGLSGSYGGRGGSGGASGGFGDSAVGVGVMEESVVGGAGGSSAGGSVGGGVLGPRQWTFPAAVVSPSGVGVGDGGGSGGGGRAGATYSGDATESFQVPTASSCGPCVSGAPGGGDSEYRSGDLSLMGTISDVFPLLLPLSNDRAGGVNHGGVPSRGVPEDGPGPALRSAPIARHVMGRPGSGSPRNAAHGVSPRLGNRSPSGGSDALGRGLLLHGRSGSAGSGGDGQRSATTSFEMPTLSSQVSEVTASDAGSSPRRQSARAPHLHGDDGGALTTVVEDMDSIVA